MRRSNGILPSLAKQIDILSARAQTEMKNHDIIYRQASLNEAHTVAVIARKSRGHFLPYLPDLHSLESEQGFYLNTVFQDCEVWVAEDNQELVGFCAFRSGWVDHLYLLPTHVGRSLGKTLLNKAKECNDSLRLWVFQRNTRAISFYKRNGFQKMKETDGSSNEEKIPDAMYEWRRQLG